MYATSERWFGEKNLISKLNVLIIFPTIVLLFKIAFPHIGYNVNTAADFKKTHFQNIKYFCK